MCSSGASVERARRPRGGRRRPRRRRRRRGPSRRRHRCRRGGRLGCWRAPPRPVRRPAGRGDERRLGYGDDVADHHGLPARRAGEIGTDLSCAHQGSSPVTDHQAVPGAVQQRPSSRLGSPAREPSSVRPTRRWAGSRRSR
ncbi:hypothetical protein FNU77_08575 [Prescottella equi]|nr:hypothetical protein FNU77_08575 [Prescottella equi]